MTFKRMRSETSENDDDCENEKRVWKRVKESNVEEIDVFYQFTINYGRASKPASPIWYLIPRATFPKEFRMILKYVENSNSIGEVEYMFITLVLDDLLGRFREYQFSSEKDFVELESDWNDDEGRYIPPPELEQAMTPDGTVFCDFRTIAYEMLTGKIFEPNSFFEFDYYRFIDSPVTIDKMNIRARLKIPRDFIIKEFKPIYYYSKE